MASEVGHISDFAAGWKRGYFDVSTGTCDGPPPVPPRRYWKPRFQGPNGQVSIQDWYAGYQEGAIAGEQDGTPFWNTLPTSGLVGTQGCLVSDFEEEVEPSSDTEIESEEIAPAQLEPGLVPDLVPLVKTNQSVETGMRLPDIDKQQLQSRRIPSADVAIKGEKEGMPSNPLRGKRLRSLRSSTQPISRAPQVEGPPPASDGSRFVTELSQRSSRFVEAPGNSPLTVASMRPLPAFTRPPNRPPMPTTAQSSAPEPSRVSELFNRAKKPASDVKTEAEAEVSTLPHHAETSEVDASSVYHKSSFEERGPQPASDNDSPVSAWPEIKPRLKRAPEIRLLYNDTKMPGTTKRLPVINRHIRSVRYDSHSKYRTNNTIRR